MNFRVLVSLALGAALLAGCGGRDDPSTPVACLAGPRAYEAALRDAPGEVLLTKEVKISDCVTENQSAGDLAELAASVLPTVTELNFAGRNNPDGEGALELGYLLGAIERGAEDTEGIHAELIRRLTVAARYSPEGPLPAAFTAAYRDGFDAGRDSG
jgi:hypothetical protein